MAQIKRVFVFNDGFGNEEIIFITNTEDIYGYGSNKDGRLGFGHRFELKEPTLIPELCGKQVVKIQFGDHFMVCLTKSGDVYTSGYNGNKGILLGNGSTIESTQSYSKPEKVNLRDQLVSDIKCCDSTTFLLTQNNQIFWFGFRANRSESNTPVLVTPLSQQEITQISCGNDHTLALNITGQVFSWGSNRFGQLGSGQRDLDIPQSVPLPDNVFVKQISCGDYHSLVLTIDGLIYAFGYNTYGQLGTRDKVDRKLPELIESKHKFIEIFCVKHMSMALSQTKNVFIWGRNKSTSNSSPAKTYFLSFQETIDNLSPIGFFSHKPLTFVQIFPKVFNNPKESDLKLKIKRKESEDYFDYIYCDKWFVAQRCQHFRLMFENNWSESMTNEIEIKGFSYEAYYQFIQCLYTDYIETKDIKVLTELLSIADLYLDEDIKDKTIEEMKAVITLENVSSLYSCAKLFNAKLLENYCLGILSRNQEIIRQTEEQMDTNFDI